MLLGKTLNFLFTSCVVQETVVLLGGGLCCSIYLVFFSGSGPLGQFFRVPFADRFVFEEIQKVFDFFTSRF